MSRQLTVTVTLSGKCPESWDDFPAAAVKARAEEVSEDCLRQIFKLCEGVIAVATATVEGGGHE